MEPENDIEMIDISKTFIEDIEMTTVENIENQDLIVSEQVEQTSQEMSQVSYVNIEGKLLHIRVGNDDSPAEPDHIVDMENRLNFLLEDNNINCLAFVTHHLVDIRVIDGSN